MLPAWAFRLTPNSMWLPLLNPPKIGQHTAQLLELCYTQSEIHHLKESGFFR